MKDAYQRRGLKQREVGEFVYAAQTWARERGVITRLDPVDSRLNTTNTASLRWVKVIGRALSIVSASLLEYLHYVSLNQE